MKSYVLITLLAVTAIQIITAQTVTTVSDLNPDDAIAIDSKGSIYASGFVDGSIYKITSQGDISSLVSGLSNANGLDFDSSDRLYVNDWTANQQQRYFADGTLDTSIAITGNPSGMLKAIDNDDMIFTRFGANTINRITPDGDISLISDASELNGPVGLAYDENGNLYVGNYNNRQIYSVGADGTLTYIATVGGSSNLGFIAFGQGRLWGTVLGEHKIYTINHNGVDDVSLFAGSTAGTQDGDISQATFTQPNGIKFDASETTLYITDFGTKNLRIISDVTLGIPSETTRLSTVTLYPNPSSDYLNINGLTTTSSISVTLTSMDGKLLKEFAFEGSTSAVTRTIFVQDLATGTYLVTIADGENSVTKQWIKE